MNDINNKYKTIAVKLYPKAYKTLITEHRISIPYIINTVLVVLLLSLSN